MCEDYNPYRAHPWSHFPLRRAHPGCLSQTATPRAATPSGMCSGSEAGSYLRLIDFCITQLMAMTESDAHSGVSIWAHGLLYHSTLGLRVIKKTKKSPSAGGVIWLSLFGLRPVVYSSPIGCTSCIVKSFRSRSSLISSPLWTPEVYGPTS